MIPNPSGDITVKRWPILFRKVTLPEDIKGRLYLHSMPGVNESLDEVWAEIKRLKITTLVRLTPTNEVQRASVRYAHALEQDTVPCSVLACPIQDHHAPDDEILFVKSARHVAELLRDGDGVLIHCFGGIGRTGMFAIATLMALGLTEEEAREHVIRAGSKPEQPAQNELLRRISPTLTPKPQ